MPSLDEITRTTGTPLANALAAGLNDISYGQTIRFTRYQRTVLPVDGFVFWVSTGETQDVQGAIHVTTGNELTEDQAYDQSSIVLTTKTEVHQFHDLAPDTVWIGDFEGVRFAISSRSSRYNQAGLFHYLGSTVTPAFQSQFIDSAAMLQKMEPVTSSSLALFLALPTLGSPWTGARGRRACPSSPHSPCRTTSPHPTWPSIMRRMAAEPSAWARWTRRPPPRTG
ncbi:hypothetical protein [Bombella apis]|uniref:hypothetical protein n=1 Tax=Bombella apis TaxID=1785988 RepID=UPI0012B7E206|nr:hypothetical protein [Bombella apis]MPW00404.1 hypothetical protein [Bombella apis]